MTRWPRPEFLPRRPRMPWLAWLWVATGASVLLLTALNAQELQTQATGLREQLAKMGPPKMGSDPINRAAPMAREALPVAWRIASGLQHGWGAVFAATEEAASVGVHWLAFEHAADRGELHLEGQVEKAEQAWAAVDVLASQPGWSEVSLQHLQPNESGQGVRFALNAHVVDANGGVR